MTKRIGIVANTTWNIYNFRLNVIEELLAQSWEIYVIAPVDEYIEYREHYDGVKHIALRSLKRDGRNPIRDLVLVEELRRKYKRLKLDFVLHYTHKPNIFGSMAANLAGIKCISVITGLGYSFLHSGYLNILMRKLYKFVSGYNEYVIFENEDDLSLFREQGLVAKEKSMAIKGCGLNLNYYKAVEEKQRQKRIFTFIGRLLRDKGIYEFVYAARDIHKRYKNVEFWIVGELDEQNPASIEHSDLVHWANMSFVNYHGFVKDIRPLITKSSCVVLPSYREGMPRTIMEAMSMSTTVIASDVAGCRETIDEGINGYLFEAKSVESLVASMERVLALSDEDLALMGHKGRIKAEKEFDAKVIASTIVGLINQLA